VKDSRLIRHDSLSGTILKTTFTFTAILPTESNAFSDSTFYALLGGICFPFSPIQIRAWNGHEFISTTNSTQSLTLLDFPGHQTVLLFNEDWITFADLRFRNTNSRFLQALFPIIDGRPIVVRASVSLSGSELENEMKLKLLSLSQKTVVKKCDLESEFTEFEKMPMPSERMSRELEESRAEGVELAATLKHLSQRLEQLREEVARERELDSEPFEGTLSKLKEERERLNLLVKSGIEFATSMRESLIGHQNIQKELRRLTDADRKLAGEFRDAKLAWSASVQEYTDNFP
jgi:hypothetical protein